MVNFMPCELKPGVSVVIIQLLCFVFLEFSCYFVSSSKPVGLAEQTALSTQVPRIYMCVCVGYCKVLCIYVCLHRSDEKIMIKNLRGVAYYDHTP